MKKYYAHAYGSQTLRSIKAESDEEALEKFKEIFGNDDFVAGIAFTTCWVRNSMERKA